MASTTTSTPRAVESPKPGASGTSSSAGKTPKPGKSRARSTGKTPKPGAGTSVLWPYLYMSPTNGLQRHQNNKRGMPLEDWRTSKLWNGNQQAAGRAAAAAGGGSQQGGGSEQGGGSQQGSSSTQTLSQPRSTRSPTTGAVEKSVLSTDKLNQLILQMVVSECVPFTLVESPTFLAIFRQFLPNMKVLTRRQLSDRVEAAFTLERDRLRCALAQQRWVSATADVWTSPGVR